MTRKSGPPPPPVRPSGTPGGSLPWLEVTIFVATFLVYLPALRGTLLWDDAGHVTRPDLRSFAGLVRIWFEFGATQQYYPVLHSAFWLEHRVWGDTTFCYHLLNVLLHASAACLFGALLRRLAVPGAALAALLFALHPVSVESVAWISEQKNTLSLVFYLAAALAYLSFDAERGPRRYAVASGWFLLALLTKTVTATLPAALLVVFWWRRGRLDWRRDVRPLLPWLALGAVSGLVTAHLERVLIGAQGADFNLTLLQRGLLAGRVIWFYLGQLAWPAHLVFIYPRWTIDPSQFWQWLFPAAALLLPAVLLGRRQRGLLAGALLFGGALFPVLGFFNIFPFVYSYVADHFQYLASLPVFALAAAGLARLGARLPRAARWGAAGALLMLLGGLSQAQSRIYRDVFTLYQATLERNPDCWMAHNNLAIALAATGRVGEAIPHLETAIRLNPGYPQTENNLGDDLLQLDRAAEALPHLERALALQPAYPVAHNNLGLALATLGRTAEAIPHFAEAIRLEPQLADAELNWGIALMLTGPFSAAVPHFERALALAPDSVHARLTYGRALAEHANPAAALPHFARAVELEPDSAEAHLALAGVLRALGRAAEARQHLLLAQELQERFR